MTLFNHVQIKVRDLRVSRQFYDAIMKVLGYNIVLEAPADIVGYGINTHDMFEIRQSSACLPYSQSVHVAFNAADRECVNNFYHIAIKNGGKCNGKPGFRPEYEAGYYAAFIIDPDGHNIEAVCMES